MTEFKNLINGELCAAASGEVLDNYNPSTGLVDSRVPRSGVEDISQAVAAAQRAFPAWRKRPVSERAQLLMKLADLIERDKEALAVAESQDQGKPLWLSRSVDIPRGSSNLRFFAHAIMSQKTQAFTDTPGVVEYIHRPAIGPCALISPWNLPLYILTWKLAPCIATGNTAICKPSELTPRTAFMLSHLIQEAGFPPGVINIVHGRGDEAGEALIQHPDVPVISFTGGTQTGGHIAKQVAPQFKKISLELGGKNPNIIFSDCDFEKALKMSVRSSFLNQGEICLCGSRLFVEKSLYPSFLERFVIEADKLVVGDPMEPRTFVGALVSKSHLEKVQSYVDLARREGGLVHTNEEIHGLDESLKSGFFMRPTVISGLAPDCRVQQEEIFGPVVTVTPFESEEEVIAMANGVKYGLSACVWTQSHDRAHRVSQRLQSGTVWVNSWMYRNLKAPLGGMKSSGLGREGGEYSLNFFTETQNISMQFEQES